METPFAYSNLVNVKHKLQFKYCVLVYWATEDFYRLSQVTTHIHAFWSHSWHGSVRRKIATVFFFHTGTAATVVSTLAAVVTCLVFGLGWLPTNDEGDLVAQWYTFPFLLVLVPS